MAPLTMDVDTTLNPDEVRAALLDFSERRADIWPELEASLYEVHSVGATSADVTEGSRMPGMTIWAREAYDWSSPDTIRWTVTESNFCTVGSYMEVTLHPREGGGTRLGIAWDRTGTTLKGKFLVKMIRLSKGKPIVSSVSKALRGIEQAKTRTTDAV